MQLPGSKVISQKAVLRVPKHPLNSSSLARRVRLEQLCRLNFPKDGFNNATLRERLLQELFYSATLEQEEVEYRLALAPEVFPLCASALGDNIRLVEEIN